jgi:tetratricopeptide (TPR) repeat protein
MDLQNFEGQLLYFDLNHSEEVTTLLQRAANAYGEGAAEPLLQQAYALAPEDLTVLVALYRFYYYQHRYQDALDIAFQAMRAVAPAISFPADWLKLSFTHLANGVLVSFTLVRFYLLALKGAAYLNLRMGNIADGIYMLKKVVEFDSKDRLGAKALLQSISPAPVADNTAMAATRLRATR